jgi:hypothetical protein
MEEDTYPDAQLKKPGDQKFEAAIKACLISPNY